MTFHKDWMFKYEQEHERAEQLETALRWYDDHKRPDGSYDGEMWGDLRAALDGGTTPEQHNPADAKCSRWILGEPTDPDARCSRCRGTATPDFTFTASDASDLLDDVLGDDGGTATPGSEVCADCGHPARDHPGYDYSGHCPCTFRFFTNAPLGGGKTFTCYCKAFRGTATPEPTDG